MPLCFQDVASQNALSVKAVAGIFYILMAGLGLGILCAVLEFLYTSKVQATRRKVRQPTNTMLNPIKIYVLQMKQWEIT